MPTAYRTCPLCEATCGLAIDVSEDGRVEKVRGDADDVFSHGFLCPKGVSLGELHHDPDRLRAPLVHGEETTWDAAFAEADRLLRGVLDAGGRDAVAVYLGNPSAHGLSAILYGRVLLKALGSKNVFSASTVDQYPKQVASGLMFGSAAAVPVPDLDRTRYLVMLGANPLASNGSLMTAPDVRGRLRAIRARGGQVVVVDPRRTRTAQEADVHLAIRPATDALLLAAVARTLAAEHPRLAERLRPLLAREAELLEFLEPFTPEAVADAVGVEARAIRALAGGLAAAAPAAVVYGRIGTTTQRHGAVASWLVDVVNVLTGALDHPGGAMFPRPAAGSSTTRGEPGRGRGTRVGRWASRVRGLPEVLGELPVATLADEVQTPGEGQVRGLITVAGNPVVSTPNTGRLDAALATLDAMVSVDLYRNETTRHAHVVLPAPSPLERPHYDIALYGFSVRDVANFSAPVVALPEGTPDEWEILLRLTGIVAGQGPDADVAALDRFVALQAVQREVGDAWSPAHGLDAEAVLEALAPRVGPERLLDLLLRCGPEGAGFPELWAPGPGELSLAALEATPHGVDLGPLRSRLPEALRTPDGRIDLAPEPLLAAGAALHELLDAVVDDGALVLIGRRHLRSNNSWMHNLPLLARGPERCTLLVHPDDAARLGLLDGARACVRSRVGEVEVPVEVTDEIRQGVVSLPHGWGHDAPGSRMRVAAERPGVSSNVLTDELDLEPLTGTAVLNGIPVEVRPAVQAPVAPVTAPASA
ncbi:molybdopterin-dependent oxidoreductase [Conexibacter sp. SYSU D00693]|uniref:molybdopterin-dependent oxidoreductase n=1 Tax=Conexibacter sp. SYSU D00693 TaxID=2812560 RepID=UPI00196ADC0F|nr:molybdopterin-dependent oxidoreductase [Conexibacter sp. SYSU D00693]